MARVGAGRLKTFVAAIALAAVVSARADYPVVSHRRTFCRLSK